MMFLLRKNDVFRFRSTLRETLRVLIMFSELPIAYSLFPGPYGPGPFALPEAARQTAIYRGVCRPAWEAEPRPV